VVRAGFGIFYARLPSASVIRLQQRNGVIQKTGTLSSSNAAQLAAGPTFSVPAVRAGRRGRADETSPSWPEPGDAFTERVRVFSIEQADRKNAALTVS